MWYSLSVNNECDPCDTCYLKLSLFDLTGIAAKKNKGTVVTINIPDIPVCLLAFWIYPTSNSFFNVARVLLLD